jgi:hypothetical protein
MPFGNPATLFWAGGFVTQHSCWFTFSSAFKNEQRYFCVNQKDITFFILKNHKKCLKIKLFCNRLQSLILQ